MERVILFGGSGILGAEVLHILNNEDIEYVAPKSSELDIRKRIKVFEFFNDFRPTWVINCAAWTDVDGAEDFFNTACEINETGVENIAVAAASIGCKVIHISTD